MQRAGSMQGSVDWFRFWLQGYENPNPQYPDQYARWRKLRPQHEWNEKAHRRRQGPRRGVHQAAGRWRPLRFDAEESRLFAPWYQDGCQREVKMVIILSGV